MDILTQILGQAGAAQSKPGSSRAGSQAAGLASIIELIKNNPQILAAILALLNPKDKSVGGSNGISELLGAMSQGGLDDTVASWVGTGPNQSLEPDALSKALGPDVVAQFAKTTGIDADQAAPVLAAVLPGLVNEMTPKGKVPQGADLDKALTTLREQLGVQ